MGHWVLSCFFQHFRARLLRPAGVVLSSLAGDWPGRVVCIWEKAIIEALGRNSVSLLILVPRTPGCCQEWGPKDSKGRLETAASWSARLASGQQSFPGASAGGGVLPEFSVLECPVPTATPGHFHFILCQSSWNQSLAMGEPGLGAQGGTETIVFWLCERQVGRFKDA